jgi:hypothetical protein
MIRPCALSAFLFLQLASAQTGRLLDVNRHLWVSYSGEHSVAGRWGVHFDAQWRRSSLGATWQQYQLRPGVNFELSPAVRLTVGYAFTRAYPYGDYPVSSAFPEHRIYQQSLVRQNVSGLRIQHRTRFEQRFIRYPNSSDRSWTYQNRFRHMVRVEVPLGEDRLGRPTWYVPIYDEILIGFPPNYGARPFDQNRLFLGIGRALNGFNFEAGYLNQFLSQRNGRIYEFNNTLFLTLTSELPISRLLRR